MIQFNIGDRVVMKSDNKLSGEISLINMSYSGGSVRIKFDRNTPYGLYTGQWVNIDSIEHEIKAIREDKLNQLGI